MEKVEKVKVAVKAWADKVRNLPLIQRIGIAAIAVTLLGGLYWLGTQPDNAAQDGLNQAGTAESEVATGKAAEEQPPAYVLAPYRGEVYAIKKPADWKVVDNLSAIEAADPNDPLTGVSGSMLLGAFGEQSPEGHIQNILNSIGATNVAYDHVSDEERVRERWTGLNWVIKTMTVTFTDAGGNRVKAKASSGILQGSGQYVAMTTSFQTTPEKWNQWAPMLERIMQTIQIIDGRRAGGYDKVRLPTAADVKSDSSPLMEAWEYRNSSGDRGSQAYSDATLGHESGLVSPSTGQEYTRPLSSYDPTEGGYRNPDQPTEILTDTY